MYNIEFLSGLTLASISGLIFLCFFLKSFFPKNGRIVYHIPLALTYILQVAVSYVLIKHGHNFQHLVIVSLLSWLCRIIAIVTCYDGKKLRNITYYSVISFSYVATRVLLTPILTVICGLSSRFYITNLDDLGYFILVCIAFASVQIFLVFQLRKLILTTKPNKIILWTTTIVCTEVNIGNLLFVPLVILRIDNPQQKETAILCAALLLALVVMTAAIVKSVIDTKKANLAAEYNYLLSHQLEEQYKHFMELNKSSSELHKLKHDVANHMLTLREMIEIETGSPIEYVNELTEKYYNASSIIICGNFIFNSEINRIKYICSENDIAFTYDVKIPEKLRIRDVDLVGVLANLLDNAVNACKLLSAEAQKYIIISASESIGIIFIAIENSCLPNAVCDTSSRNLEHGWGIKIIQEVTQKYDGVFSLEIVNDKAFSSATLVDELK